jgi:hypothetical protein
MSGLEFVLVMTLGIVYIACIVTVCYLTFLKGYWVLGLIGFLLPILWLIGAVLPAKAGSRYEVREARKNELMIERMTR